MERVFLAAAVPEDRVSHVGDRRLSGWAVTYSGLVLGSVPMVIGPDAFTATACVGRPVLLAHDMARPVGVIRTARSLKAGLRITCELARTGDANDALELAKLGAIPAFSVGFDIGESLEVTDPEQLQLWGASAATIAEARRYRSTRVVTKADLAEVSLVALPADKRALIDRPGREEQAREVEAVLARIRSEQVAEVEAGVVLARARLDIRARRRGRELSEINAALAARGVGR